MSDLEQASGDTPLAAAPERSHAAQRGQSRLRWFIGRIGWGIFMLWLVSTLTFIGLHIAPGGPIAAQTGPGVNLTGAALQAMKTRLGLNQSVLGQYFTYMGHLVTGNLGTSFSLQLPVRQVLTNALPSTLVLTLTALIIAWLVALATTLITVRRKKGVDEFGRSTEITMASLPDFWIGLLLLTLFGATLHWVPVGGGGFGNLILPALALAIPLGGYLGQVTRQSFEDALDQPFILTARARGQSDRAVRIRHALRHAAMPGVSLSGVMVGWLISGSVAIEQVYARRGLGTILLNAVNAQDYPVVLGVALVLALTYVAVNLVVDLLYPLLDPRLRAN